METSFSSTTRRLCINYVEAHNAFIKCLVEDWNEERRKMWNQQYEIELQTAKYTYIRQKLTKWCEKTAKSQYQKNELAKIFEYVPTRPEIPPSVPFDVIPKYISVEQFGYKPMSQEKRSNATKRKRNRNSRSQARDILAESMEMANVSSVDMTSGQVERPSSDSYESGSSVIEVNEQESQMLHCLQQSAIHQQTNLLEDYSSVLTAGGATTSTAASLGVDRNGEEEMENFGLGDVSVQISEEIQDLFLQLESHQNGGLEDTGEDAAIDQQVLPCGYQNEIRLSSPVFGVDPKPISAGNNETNQIILNEERAQQMTCNFQQPNMFQRLGEVCDAQCLIPDDEYDFNLGPEVAYDLNAALSSISPLISDMDPLLPVMDDQLENTSQNPVIVDDTLLSTLTQNPDNVVTFNAEESESQGMTLFDYELPHCDDPNYTPL